MTYADRAKRFLADRRSPAPSPNLRHEINEGNEETRHPRAMATLPRDCIGPRACAVLGPCTRHERGAPCVAVTFAGDPTIEGGRP